MQYLETVQLRKMDQTYLWLMVQRAYSCYKDTLTYSLCSESRKCVRCIHYLRRTAFAPATLTSHSSVIHDLYWPTYMSLPLCPPDNSDILLLLTFLFLVRLRKTGPLPLTNSQLSWEVRIYSLLLLSYVFNVFVTECLGICFNHN